jgi:putative endonuclease
MSGGWEVRVFLSSHAAGQLQALPSPIPLVPADAGTQLFADSDPSMQKSPAMSFYVYILASERNGTLYVGMTDDLSRRVGEHQAGVLPGFTKKYGVKTLVWSEVHETRESAFVRERQIKKWKRKWKLQLIEELNPEWKDLVEAGWLW